MSENSRKLSENTSLTSKYEALEGQKQVEPSKQVHKQVRARFRHIERQVSWNRSHELPTHTEVCRLLNDAQTGMLPGYPESAICVQRFDDSLNSAIHTTYRNWLRSSSMHEPRDPPLEVVTFRFIEIARFQYMSKQVRKNTQIGCTNGAALQSSAFKTEVTPLA